MRKFNIYVTPEKNFVTRQRSNKVSKDTKAEVRIGFANDKSPTLQSLEKP
jgi:hypothetical protein